MRSKHAPVADPSALIRRALGLCRMLRNWPPEVLDELTALSRLGRYERHQQVRAADPKRREVLVVASGCVEVGGVDATGSRFVLSMHSAGDIVGLARLLEHTQFVYDYHAHQPTVLVEIPGESFLALLDAHPLLWKDICLLVLARMHELIVVQQRHAFSNIDNRVASPRPTGRAWCCASRRATWPPCCRSRARPSTRSCACWSSAACCRPPMAG